MQQDNASTQAYDEYFDKFQLNHKKEMDQSRANEESTTTCFEVLAQQSTFAMTQVSSRSN